MKDNTIKIVVIALIVFGVIFGAVTLTNNSEDRNNPKVTMSRADALEKLDKLYSKITVKESQLRYDPDFSDDEAIAVLPQLNDYDFVVNPTTADYITIYSSPEKSGTGYSNWLIELAEKFNAGKVKIDEKIVSVGIRSIPNDVSTNFISSGKHIPDVFMPSSELWGDMLMSKGVKIDLLDKRMAGNVPGIILYNKKNDELADKYGKLNYKNIIEEILKNEISIAYSNPLSNSEGLNFILTALVTFNSNDPIGEDSVLQLRKLQDNIRFVAYDSAQLKMSALNGTLDGFVSDHLTYVNSPELKSSYTFIPFGVRHDQPAYIIGELSSLKKQTAQQFIEYCKTAEAQKAAADKGFNGLEDYTAAFTKPDSTIVLQAQETWKKEKNGSSDMTAIFVADVSGSMDGSPLLKLKASLNSAATFIDTNTNVGLITFSDNVNIALPIAKFDDNHKRYFSGAVKAMSAGGATAMFDAIVVAQKMLVDAQTRNPNTKLKLFVLTDGETNRGCEFKDVEGIIGGLEIQIYTIGYNEDIEILEKVSAINEATSINAETDDVIAKLQSLFNAQM